MVVALGPRPQQGRPSQVEIIDTAGQSYPLQLVENAYQVKEAQRFGDKISVGPLSYQDFNPYESATVSAHFHAGYGLRRYSDWTGQDDAYGFILESSNIDTRHDIAILSDAPAPWVSILGILALAAVLLAISAWKIRGMEITYEEA